jgi:MerR family transcriptional regulator, heat shock protein HspR
VSSERGESGRSAAWGPALAAFPGDTVPLYTVGQVSEMLGVQPAFLRRLDSMNVVNPSRSTGGQRRYTRLQIDEVHKVTQLIGEGLTLNAVQRILLLQAEIADLRRQLDQGRSQA